MPRTLPPLKGNEKVWRDILPKESLQGHGRHLYMFRNTATNQVVYTLHPRIEVHLLARGSMAPICTI
jgi:allantoicase